MKKVSRRLRRMDRHHKMRKAPPLNMVSLMDIFTILVFFLLVNSSSAPQLPSARDMTLPSSIAQKVPEETLVLMITADSLLVQGRRVASVDELAASEDAVFEPLQRELELQRRNRRLSAPLDDGTGVGSAITIMGDENISYGLLRKILATCQQANYTEIAFAAEQRAAPGS